MNPSVKKFIVRVLFAVTAFAGIYTVFSVIVAATTVFTPDIESLFFYKPYMNGGQYQRASDLDKWLDSRSNSTPSGLMLGSSVVFLNVDPFILGKKTGIDFFCAASSSQDVVNSQHILEHCLRSKKRIDYIFLGVNYARWGTNNYESSIDWTINNYKPYRRYVFEMVATCNEHLLWMNFFYYSIKRMLPFGQEHFRVEKDDSRYMGKGFVCYTDYERTRKIEPFIEVSQMSTGNYASLKKIITICEHRNIKLVIFLPKILNAQYDSGMLRIIKEPLITAVTCPIDTNLFYDNYHLYCKGTVSYTEWIADKFNQLHQYNKRAGN